MQTVPAGVSLNFEVTFDVPGLPVAMSVYDVSGVSPILVSGPTAMFAVVGNTYGGKFTALEAKSYIIVKAVYTDGTFTTLSSNYSQGSESIVAENLNGSSTNGAVIGIVDNHLTVVGLVNC